MPLRSDGFWAWTKDLAVDAKLFPTIQNLKLKKELPGYKQKKDYYMLEWKQCFAADFSERKKKYFKSQSFQVNFQFQGFTLRCKKKKRAESIKPPDDYTALSTVLYGSAPRDSDSAVLTCLWVFLSICPVCSERRFVIVVQKMHYAYVVHLWWLYKGLCHSDSFYK